jgi:uncharacterized metal-binding protein YceD (DUF177 family)
MTAKPMSGAAPPPQVFSYPINVTDVPEGGLDVSIAADAASLEALARLDGLAKLSSLEAEFHIVQRPGQTFNVSGEMRATITQICVVSLEPFETRLVEPIDVDFAAIAASDAAASAMNLPRADAGDLPDPIVDGKIDLGALAAEFLALGLDPYPKKPGVAFEPPATAAEDGQDSPFAVLRKLKSPS